MRTQEQDAAARRVTLVGNVAASGTITAGTGFTVTKSGTGLYTIRFVVPFRALVGWSAITVAAAGFVVVTGGDRQSVAFSTFTYAANPADEAFYFSAVGIAA